MMKANDLDQNPNGLPLRIREEIDQVCDRFEETLKAGQPIAIESALSGWDEHARNELLRELLILEIDHLGRLGSAPERSEYEQRFSENEAIVRDVFDTISRRREILLATINLNETRGNEDVEKVASSIKGLPNRYSIKRLLGSGGFGRVYLAEDRKLQRLVAIKIPHRAHLPGNEQTSRSIDEARIAAQLDHPNIVPVYDVGSTSDGWYFVVSKYIEGKDLATLLQKERFGYSQMANLIAQIAMALHHTHTNGLVHRDIKPANILVDSDGIPHLADFGLALTEDDFGKSRGIAGSVAYLSPEQARGEGHLLDGRSDIYSLGVVLFEMLTGNRPFQGSSDEVMERIISLEPRPPRQMDESIPRELERICLKCLSKRLIDRYTTAHDLSHDLKLFGSEYTADSNTTANKSGGDQRAKSVQVVPKGLRSFDFDDADFFLKLLPGAVDRNGLPESIRFWTTRIATPDHSKSFRVGVIYGPSGSGKSSLVKAGLIPRLPEAIEVFYIDSTSDQTERNLLRRIHAAFVDTAQMDLATALTYLRRKPQKNILIVLDQFEQWLNANSANDGELIRALRHCDGSAVQSLLVVRDDFWMATTHFVQSLDVELVSGSNVAIVDRLNQRDAKSVLRTLGQAHGALPEKVESEQDRFLDQVVRELAEDGDVICMRLALFAEMVKGRPWTLATLHDIGGVEGVGTTFLHETFSSRRANPGHRCHQKAITSVLRALLPRAGERIRGHVKSRADLKTVSGYDDNNFDRLMRILDKDTRLITPVETDTSRADCQQDSGTIYQLTHDYLVPSIRAWSTRKQKETRQGRAELLLAERTTFWETKKELKQLPSFFEYARIAYFTKRRDWEESQIKMMKSASRYYTAIGCVLLMTFGLLGRTAHEYQGQRTAESLVDRLVRTETQEVLPLVEEIHHFHRWTSPLLRQRLKNTAPNTPAALHLRLALLPYDKQQLDPVFEYMLKADALQLGVVRDALLAHQNDLREQLWDALKSESRDKRFRASCVLTSYDADIFALQPTQWQQQYVQIVHDLIETVQENSADYEIWLELLYPLRDRFLSPLSVIIQNEGRDDSHRFLALRILEYFGLQDAFAKRITDRINLFSSKDDVKSHADSSFQRTANGASALLMLGRGQSVWPLLGSHSDPSVRSYLIHRIGTPWRGPIDASGSRSVRSINPDLLMDRLDRENDLSIMQAMILALGEFEPNDLVRQDRNDVVSLLSNLYRNHADSGIHSAAEWALTRWQKEIPIDRTNDILRAPNRDTPHAPNQQRVWYVNSENHTMIVIRSPVVFVQGSSSDDPNALQIEWPRREKTLERSFEIASKEVTIAQFQRFVDDKPPMVYAFNSIEARYSAPPDGPAIGVSWCMAAAYCNWLSEKSEIPKSEWCYLPNEAGKYGPGMRPAEDYLHRTGYRLPSEEEWECACRAGTESSRFFGESDALLPMYAWTPLNASGRAHRVGSLKPNDWGLFDMLGNVWEWCHERSFVYSEHPDPTDVDVVLDQNRILRGGAYNFPDIRSARRGMSGPTDRGERNFGFRVARTHR